MNDHIAGPWHVYSPDDESGDYDAAIIRADSPQALAQSGLMDDHRGVEVAVVLHYSSAPASDTTAMANAYLIAAAPEMYEALQKVLAEWLIADHDPVGDAIRAAIGKAEGATTP